MSIACSTTQAGPAERAQAIEREVWSPYCPGRLLSDCTTAQARELRDEIGDRIERGESSDDVLEWIRRNHGDEALARPELRGAGFAIWLVPVLLFAIGALVVARVIRKWSRASA